VVLVHGGGGTAFVQWIEEWTDRGYAAIAMDTVGCRPVKRFEGANCRVELKGDRPEMLRDFDWEVANIHDSWTAHAVATVIRSHSYLRSLPEVDAARVGITGISWGGYLTCITAAVDGRFSAAVPVYGCGFLGEFEGTVKKATEPWLRLFDPCMFLRSVKCPILFVNRPVDTAYYWEQWLRSSFLPPNASRSCRIGFGHSHTAGRVPEAPLFLDVFCKGAPKLPMLEKQVVEDGVVSAKFNAEATIERATIAWSEDDDSVDAPKRNWQEVPAEIKGNVISAPVPPNAKRFYLNLFDSRGGVVSTDGFGWDSFNFNAKELK
jgi:dienelactone hydrolase